jgi:cell division protein FtsB
MIMKMRSYVADELSNKVYHLHKALQQAQDIIKILEEENQNLKKTIELLETKEELVVA